MLTTALVVSLLAGCVDERAELRAQPDATLLINTRPASRVLVDGVETGQVTPIARVRPLKLTPGPHILTFVVQKGDVIRHYRYRVVVTPQEHKLIIMALGSPARHATLETTFLDESGPN